MANDEKSTLLETVLIRLQAACQVGGMIVESEGSFEEAHPAISSIITSIPDSSLARVKFLCELLKTSTFNAVEAQKICETASRIQRSFPCYEPLLVEMTFLRKWNFY